MYLRFLQLKRSGNVKLRNKMKKGKAGWFVVSMCFFGAGLVFMGNPAAVHADEIIGNNVQTESSNLTPQKNVDNKAMQQPVNNALTGDNGSQVKVKSEGNINNQPISQADSQTNQVETNNLDKGSNTEAETTNQVGNSTISQRMMKEGSDSNLDKTSGMGDATNIAESKPGADGTWYLSSDGVLHMIGGTFATVVTDADYPDDRFETSFGFDYIVAPQVKTIDVDNTVKVGEKANSLFRGLENLTGINGMENLDTSNTTDMSNMFAYDENLDTQKIDFSKFDTSNVTDMHGMFNIAFVNNDDEVNPRPTLDLSHFNTSKVTNMSDMFESARGLVGIDLNNWDTSSVTDMNDMFYDVMELENADLSSFNTEKVTSMAGMFGASVNLKSVNLSSFKTPNLTAIMGMFTGCDKLESIDLSSFDMSNIEPVYSTYGMFSNNVNLKKIKVNRTSILDRSDLPEITPNDLYTGEWDGEIDAKGEKISLKSSELTALYPNNNLRNKPITQADPADIANTTTYTWEKNISKPTDVTLKTNLGDKIIKDVTGPLDSDIEIDVPEVAGYTATPSKVKVHIDENGVVTLPSTGDYDVTYSLKKPSGGSSHHSDSDKNTNSVEQLNQTVMTYHNQGNIKLYTMDGQEITNRELYPGSDWFSDEVVTHNNVKYYRVATNELVKAEDALVYVDHADTIVTKDGAPKSLSNEHSQNVSDRKLMSNTAWKTDRYAFFNGTKFYRVATNEWVNAEDVQDNL